MLGPAERRIPRRISPQQYSRAGTSDISLRTSDKEASQTRYESNAKRDRQQGICSQAPRRGSGLQITQIIFTPILIVRRNNGPNTMPVTIPQHVLEPGRAAREPPTQTLDPPGGFVLPKSTGRTASGSHPGIMPHLDAVSFPATLSTLYVARTDTEIAREPPVESAEVPIARGDEHLHLAQSGRPRGVWSRRRGFGKGAP